MTTRTFAVIWFVVALCATPARADKKSDAAVHVKKADTHYKLGRFEQALASYSAAYELYPVPPLLFNLAQCHRNLKNWERAVFFFEGYLRARPNASNRTLVEDLLAESRRELEAQQALEAKQKAEAEALAKREAEERERLRIEAERKRLEEEQKLKLEAERKRLEDERAAAARRVAEEERLRAQERERKAREERERNKFYRQWWFWTAVGGVAAAAGGTAYYFSGETTVIPPSGTLGGVDRR